MLFMEVNSNSKRFLNFSLDQIVPIPLRVLAFPVVEFNLPSCMLKPSKIAILNRLQLMVAEPRIIHLDRFRLLDVDLALYDALD